jgi:hypothetical protein
MVYIFIYVFLYLILVLFFWSLSAISKKAVEKFVRRFESVSVNQDVSDAWSANARCQVYTIQSLYSQDFIVPEDPHINYTFRNPLPSFEGKCGISVFCRDFTSQISYTNQIDTLRYGHINNIRETQKISSHRMERLCSNGESV